MKCVWVKVHCRRDAKILTRPRFLSWCEPQMPPHKETCPHTMVRKGDPGDTAMSAAPPGLCAAEIILLGSIWCKSPSSLLISRLGPPLFAPTSVELGQPGSGALQAADAAGGFSCQIKGHQDCVWLGFTGGHKVVSERLRPPMPPSILRAENYHGNDSNRQQQRDW